MHPRPTDLAVLARLLPPGAIVLSYDLETCADPAGGDARVPGKARIVQLGISAFSASPLPGVTGDPVYLPAEIDEAEMFALVPATESPNGAEVAGYIYADQTYVNPQCRIDPGSAAVHKITDAQARSGPTLAELADDIAAWLDPSDPPENPDASSRDARTLYLCGYNAVKYDVPVLAHEMRRIGRLDVAALVERARVLDCMLIRRAAEPPFTLGGTLSRYGLADLGDAAHNADADALANLAVLAAQAAVGHLTDLASATGLGAPRPPPKGAVDSQGKLQWVAGQAPVPPTPTLDNVRIEFGTKAKGQTLRVAGASYARWICGADFPDDVKAAIKTAWGPAAARW